MAAVSFEKRPMLYNGVFGCHGNTFYVIFIGVFFGMIHSIGPINVCTDFEINRYKIDEFRKRYVVCHGGSIFDHTHWAWCTGISMRSFIIIRPVLMGDTAADTNTHTNKHTHTEGHSNSLANPFGARLIIIYWLCIR